jgi:uncharacterized protein (TIGR00159 family)
LPGISELLNSFRILDLLDILLIGFAFYGLLVWFRRTRSRLVLAGIGLLGIVYFISRWLQLYMTAVLLQSLFAVIIFAFIVLFQEELRRFFERLALWGGFRKKAPAFSSEHVIEVLAQTAVNLTRRKIGALIVLQGADPLERHVQGGIRLDGTLSEQLLESIFDPNSGGHDGAVIIDRGKVAQFGCHLPLSSNFREFGNLGLRHTAALGLAEVSDSLCIVLSEERGSISTAYNGELKVLDNAAQLKLVLDGFFARMSPKEKKSAFSWFRAHFAEKAAAVLMAVLVWIGLGYQRETVQRDFTIPIEYRNVDPEWVIEEPKILDAKIMLMGPEQAFRLFDASSLKISLDLAGLKQGGQEIALTKEMIRTPRNLSVVGLKPDRIYVMAYRLLSRSCPVEIKTAGSLPPGVFLQKMECSPSSVTALVPPKLLKNGLRITTKPIDLRQITASASISSEIDYPAEVRFPSDRPPTVIVNIRVRTRS